MRLALGYLRTFFGWHRKSMGNPVVHFEIGCRDMMVDDLRAAPDCPQGYCQFRITLPDWPLDITSKPFSNSV
jgi:hypothetical protein